MACLYTDRQWKVEQYSIWAKSATSTSSSWHDYIQDDLISHQQPPIPWHTTCPRNVLTSRKRDPRGRKGAHLPRSGQIVDVCWGGIVWNVLQQRADWKKAQNAESDSVGLFLDECIRGSSDFSPIDSIWRGDDPKYKNSVVQKQFYNCMMRIMTASGLIWGVLLVTCYFTFIVPGSY